MCISWWMMHWLEVVRG